MRKIIDRDRVSSIACCQIWTHSSATTTNYIYRAGQVLYTTDRQGQRRAFNIYSPTGNIIAARQYCASSNFQDMYVTYISDIRGSITSIVNDGMSFIQGYRYTDYGITTRIGSGAFNEFAYTQGIWDETTGLYYLNARFYNPVDGRFLTQDPYRGSNDQPDTWHLHGYCAGDPVNWIDPTGHRRQVIRTNVTTGWRTGLWRGGTRVQNQHRAIFRMIIIRTTDSRHRLNPRTISTIRWDMIWRERRTRSRSFNSTTLRYRAWTTFPWYPVRTTWWLHSNTHVP